MTQLSGKSRLALISAGICFFWTTDSAADTVRISSDPFTNPSSQHMTEVEPHIFANGSTIVATFQQGRFFGGGCSDVGFATSVDNGATWREGSLPGLTIFSGGDRYERVSDPSVAYNAAYGLWLIESLAVGGPEIFVSRSADGLSWDNPITAALGNTPSFFDKPWITCDNTPTSRFFGNCYIEWDDFGLGGTVLMTTSTNGGASWADPLATADQAVGLGGQPLVQPSGRVVVPFRSFDGNIRSFVSDDGGLSWGETVQVSNLSDHFVAGDLRAIALPSAAIDGDGKIYVAWADCRFRSSCQANDIVISTSSDGLSWADVSRVPLAASTSTADFFIPGLGADRHTFAPNVGLALVYYYYPQADCTETTCQLTGGFVTSRNGGGTWSAAIDVTRPMSTDWLADTNQGRMVGDYVAAYYTDDGVPHPVFAGAVTPTEQFLESMFTTCSSCSVPEVAQTGAARCDGADCLANAEPRPAAESEAKSAGSQGPGMRIVAPSYRINVGTFLQLQTAGSETQNASIEWSVEEGAPGGTVSNSGLYRAPFSPGVYHLVASNGAESARVAIQVFTVR